MDVQGYVYLKSNADCSKAMGKSDIWVGNILRAMEINENTKSVLLIDSSATQMGMFEMSDVILKFTCEEFSGVIMPKGLGMVEKMAYAASRQGRIGGYPLIVKNMVIASSLEKGEVNDDFLF